MMDIAILVAIAVLGFLLFRLQGGVDMLGRQDKSATMTASLADFSQKQQESLAKIRERMATIEQLANTTLGGLDKEVRSLQKLMDNPHARGAFGEVSLEALVRDQLPAKYYAFQHQFKNGGRVDCLLRFDAPLGPLSIDAKFPLQAYRAVLDCQDKQARPALLKELERAVRQQIKAIAEKYIIAEETSDKALMFVPSEAVFITLYRECEGIIEEAQRKRVFIVSPTTLWAVVNTMRAVLRNVRVIEQASLIQQKVQALLEDIGRLQERNSNLNRHFNAAVKDLREIETSVDKIGKKGDDILALELGEDSKPRLRHDKEIG